MGVGCRKLRPGSEGGEFGGEAILTCCDTIEGGDKLSSSLPSPVSLQNLVMRPYIPAKRQNNMQKCIM